MATRKKRGGRPARGVQSKRNTTRISAPSGLYRLQMSDELLAVVDADEVQACFERALRNLKAHFQVVNKGNAAVTKCKSRSGISYYIAIDFTDIGSDGAVHVHAGLPHEFGQNN